MRPLAMSGVKRVRRRRRRSSFSRGSGGAGLGAQGRLILIGAGAVVLVGAFVFFMHQADVLAPEPAPMRIELPDAFKGNP